MATKEEEEREGAGTNGAKHGGRWLTPPGHVDPEEERWPEGEQQCSEEKQEILKLLRGWQEKETSPIVRWAWADESTEEESNQE